MKKKSYHVESNIQHIMDLFVSEEEQGLEVDIWLYDKLELGHRLGWYNEYPTVLGIFQKGIPSKRYYFDKRQFANRLMLFDALKAYFRDDVVLVTEVTGCQPIDFKKELEVTPETAEGKDVSNVEALPDT